MQPLKIAIFTLLAMGVVLFAGAWHVAGQLASPAFAEIGPAPNWLDAKPVEIASGSGAVIKGWRAGPEYPTASVLLLHPVRGNRRSMLSRARFLIGANYQVLLVDLQAHGASSGERITYGFLESRDVSAAVEYLRQSSTGVPIFVIGASLGGAAALLANPALSVDGLILEAVYPTIEVAVQNRLSIRFGTIGKVLAPLFLLQFQTRTGIDSDKLRPVDSAKNIEAPVLVIAGEKDKRTTLADTQMLFDSIDSPKQLWIVPNAAHEDFYSVAAEEYEFRVLVFLSEALDLQPKKALQLILDPVAALAVAKGPSASSAAEPGR